MPQIAHRLTIIRHWPHITLGDHPSHMFFRACLDPDRMRARQQGAERAVVGDNAAASRDDRTVARVQYTLQATRFIPAIGRLPCQRKQVIKEPP